MRFTKTPLFIAIAVFCAMAAQGQVSKSVRSSGFRVPTVSRNKARIMCPIFENSEYPYQGIGFKLGDPFAMTYKYYPNKNWSFAADFGKAASGLYNKYYRESFFDYIPDTLTTGESVHYLAHKALSDWFIEAKFLYQWDASKISKGLQAYAGLGWQWRATRLEFDYLFTEGDFITDNRFGKFQESRFTYGPVVIVGFEYSYFSLPLSAFIEIEMYTDALLDPGYKRFQGGVGLRYVF